jgi:hypothetical protein
VGYYRNFNPQWGYAAPAPGLLRSARSIVVAAIVGATAGASTVFSLLDRPVAEESVAARTLVAPDNSTSVAVQQPIELHQVKSPAEAGNSAEQKALSASTAARPQPSELPTTLTPQRPTSGAELAEVPAVKETLAAQTFNNIVAVVPDSALAQKPQTKKPRITPRTALRADASRYDARRYDRYFNGPRYGYEPRYEYVPRYGSRGSFASAPYY